LSLGLVAVLLALSAVYSGQQENPRSAVSAYHIDWQAFLSGSAFDSSQDTVTKYRLLSCFGQPIVGVTGTGEYYAASGFVSDSAPVPVKVVEVETATLPNRYDLAQNYPNPFNPTTVIQFSLPRSGLVTLEIFDITGRKVITLVGEELEAGVKRVTWDGCDRRGVEVASGVYLYRLRVNDFSDTRKMLLLK
jgi:hypothetical protein